MLDFDRLSYIHKDTVSSYKRKVAEAKSLRQPVEENITCELWEPNPFATVTFNSAVKGGKGFQLGSNELVGYLSLISLK